MRILYIEWLKVRKYRAFIVLALLSAAGIFGASYIVSNMEGVVRVTMGPNPLTGAVLGRPFDFPEVWHTVSWISSFMHLLPALLMIMLICNEYNFRTNRQNVIDGLSREQFMWGKIMLGVGLSLAMSVMVFITACVFGVQGGHGFSLDGIEYVGLYFVQSLAHVSVAMVMATLFKRSGMSIGIYFLYVFIIENVLSMILLYRFGTRLGAFLPLDSSDKLIEAPTAIGAMIRSSSDLPATGWLLAVSAGWIILEMWFCRVRFCRTDL